MTAHTPGPWTVKRESDRSGWRGIAIANSDGSHVANMIGQLDDRELANARLMAAAPELLKQRDHYRKLLADLVEAIENEGLGHSDRCDCQFCQDYRAAKEAVR